MPLRKATNRPNFDFATAQRRRNLKSSAGRIREADRILNQVFKRIGGKIITFDDGKLFGLDFSSLKLNSLPNELFEDEFLFEKCEKYLIELNVSNNELKSLDLEIGDFLHLRTLNCSNNRYNYCGVIN